jgi:hypothetical protein
MFKVIDKSVDTESGKVRFSSLPPRSIFKYEYDDCTPWMKVQGRDNNGFNSLDLTDGAICRTRDDALVYELRGTLEISRK